MEWHIHGVFDRCHGKSVEEFESVENFEPSKEALITESFDMSPESIMQSCDLR